MAFLILARVIKQTFVINDVVNGSRYWIFTVDITQLYSDFLEVFINIFFSCFWRYWFSPCCEATSLPSFCSCWRSSPSSSFVGQSDSKRTRSCLLPPLNCLEWFLQKGMWVAGTASAVLFQHLLGVPICVLPQGNMSLLHVRLKKNLAF